MSVLVIAEVRNQKFSATNLSVITAASKLESNVDVLIMGCALDDVVNEAKAVQGVNKIIVADSEVFRHGLAEPCSTLIVSLSEEYTHLMMSASTTGKNIMPRVAALLDVEQVSDVVEVLAEDLFKRPIYAGNAIATVQSNYSKKVLTIRTTAFDKAVSVGGDAETIQIEPDVQNDMSTFVSEELSSSERPDLESASIVISGGRGMQSGENFQLLETVADKLGAAVGASRAAVDAGFVSNDMQVGQTGKIVAPDLYIAVGISGAIQHLAGMKGSKYIVAINKDEDAPIFEVADYGLVADLFEVLPDLSQKL